MNLEKYVYYVMATKHVKRKSRKTKRRGGASNDRIRNSVMALQNSPSCSKKSECHRSFIGLTAIAEHAGYALQKMEIDEDNDIDSIIQKIKTIIGTGHHLILNFESYGHFWFLETKNKQFRILSLWSENHSFSNYMRTGPYGQFKDDVDPFFESLRKLSSNHRNTIEEGNMELFGTTTTLSGNYLYKLVLFGLYNVKCVHPEKKCSIM